MNCRLGSQNLAPKIHWARETGPPPHFVDGGTRCWVSLLRLKVGLTVVPAVHHQASLSASLSFLVLLPTENGNVS